MADHAAVNSGLALSNGVYDVLRQIVEKVFPGLGVFYAALAVIWGWGYEVEVGGSFAALTVLGGILLTFARKGYAPAQTTSDYGGPFVGQVVEGITEDGAPTLKLQLDPTAANDILNAKYLVFKGLNSA